MKYKDYTDEELIQMHRDGNREVGDYIMKKYIPLVRKKTNAMYLIGGEQEDLIQEGMVGLFNAVRDFNPDKDVSFFAFAEICISRKLYNALEESNRKKHMPLNNYISFSVQDEPDGINLEQMMTDQSTSPEQLMIEQEFKKEFFAKLEEKLSPMERKVLHLYLEGHNYLQIAEMLGKTPKSMDNTLQRIRGKGKTLIEEIS